MTLERERVIEAYHAIEPQVEAGRFRPYREVLAETARRVAAECGWTISAERAGFPPRSLGSWPPFRDTNPALERMAGRVRLGILSNVDEGLLDRTRRRLSVDFDFWVTADRVESYSPISLTEAARPVGILRAGSTSPRACSTTWRRRIAFRSRSSG